MAIGGRRSMPQWRSSSSAVTFSMALPEFDVRIAAMSFLWPTRAGGDVSAQAAIKNGRCKPPNG